MESSNFGLARYNADGSLDETFGTGGLVSTDIQANSVDQGRALTIQDDGKVLVTGSTFVSGRGQVLTIARYGTDGSLDPSFGRDGIVTSNLSSQSQSGHDIVVSGNRILVAGSHYEQFDEDFQSNEFLLAAYNISNGSLDTSFGDEGFVTTDFSEEELSLIHI